MENKGNTATSHIFPAILGLEAGAYSHSPFQTHAGFVRCAFAGALAMMRRVPQPASELPHELFLKFR